ncbi:PREDICTED: F-actin-uncapping protein LRRC16A-like [Amphimedon queenslandica]|uniref:CARMIL pleckstrin homology domain-containing protein n=1 Tax=Amphimedon queenslandica TaxID=400682 RepID=A0AAN0JFB1_AMPQE|nr:PREDICTED: F-actin-uncapping protein LRRC16A-like [Amphimedon queenslandica]|eukprot:XP_019855654.1 PREDICTED: F-actin-uncapping protein LRRC16A-like [Amphimedon queenslandica]
MTTIYEYNYKKAGPVRVLLLLSAKLEKTAMASSEDKSLDIFGKPLELTEQEIAVLGDDAVRVFLRRVLSVETHTKKGIVSDPKTLVVSSSRCHVIAQKPSVKLETSFNFLKITLIECSEKKLVFHLIGEGRPREFTTDRKNGVTIVGLILAQLKNLFPVTPLDTLIKASYSTESINSEVSLLHESLRQAMDSSDPNSLESFITIYGFLCDLHNIPYIAEISSYLRAAYWTHGFRELNLRDFEHFSIRDLLPLVATLRHNNYFDSFSVDGMKVTGEVFDELAHTLVHSQTLKKLKLTNCSLKP